jgi:hypothetical protein
MFVELFVLLILAYILADYVIRGERIVQSKNERRFVSMVSHVASYALLAALFTLPWLSWRWFWMLVLQIVLHAIVYIFKIQLLKQKVNIKFELEVLAIILHGLVIGLTIRLINQPFESVQFWNWIQALYESKTLYQLCIYASAVIFLIKGGTSLTRSLLEKLKKKTIRTEKIDENEWISDEEYYVGQLIGNLERILILIFIVTNHLAAIGFVIAAKSVARFKEMDDKQFAEYYLIGTMASSLIAILVGGLVMIALSYFK